MNALKQKNHTDTGNDNAKQVQVSNKKAPKGTQEPGCPMGPHMNRVVQSNIDNLNLSLVVALMTDDRWFYL